MKHDGLSNTIKWLEKLKRNWIRFLRCYTIEEHRTYHDRGYSTRGCVITIVCLCWVYFFVWLLFSLVFKKDSDYSKGYGLLVVLGIIVLVFVGLLLVVIIEAILKLILKIKKRKDRN